MKHRHCQVAEALPRGAELERRLSLAAGLALPPVDGLPSPGVVLVVAGDRIEGSLRDAAREQGRGGAEQAVAALHVVVEEGEGPARIESFEPEGDLAELDGH